MKFIITFLVAVAATINVALAQTIIMHVPYSKTGNVQAQTRMLVEDLEFRGWKIDLKITSNPRLSSAVFQQTQDPMIMVWGSDLIDGPGDPAYLLPPKTQHVAGILYVRPIYICTAKNISVQDIMQPGSKFTVGMTPVSMDQRYLQAFNEYFGTQHRGVIYDSSKLTEAAMISGEIDLVLTSRGIKFVAQGKATCPINVSSFPAHGMSQLSKLDSRQQFRFPDFSAVVYLQTRNISQDQLDRLRKDIIEIHETNARLRDYQSLNGFPRSPLTADAIEQTELIQKYDQLLRD